MGARETIVRVRATLVTVLSDRAEDLGKEERRAALTRRIQECDALISELDFDQHLVCRLIRGVRHVLEFLGLWALGVTVAGWLT